MEKCRKSIELIFLLNFLILFETFKIHLFLFDENLFIPFSLSGHTIFSHFNLHQILLKKLFSLIMQSFCYCREFIF